ncbi:DUF3284 domain-containing protein [Streptococcus halichoeri]|uniref:DUF3284 domain-containing protein n=1 Tax=Streptococcus halichoeri TaxID=254785 RepID=UPI00135C2EFE|nr:DUF3284 domain-containing protein [Streptococcus halichoeri]
MQVSKVYEVKSDIVFKLLTQLFIEDYQASTATIIRTVDIVPGLVYTKKSSKLGSFRVKVLVFDRPKHYKVEVTSSRGKQEISYQLQQHATNSTRIIFSESHQSTDWFHSLNYRLLQPLFKKKLEKRMLLQMDKLVEFAK